MMAIFSARFLLSRLKRCVIMSTLLSFILGITLGVMTVLNRSHLGLALSGAGQPINFGSLGFGSAGRRTARPMVQFYPDNQNKLLFRKASVAREEEAPLETLNSEVASKAPVPALKPTTPSQNVNYDVHIFYYGWYGRADVDGQWLHWNHEYLANWDTSDKKVYPTGRHDPEAGDIGSNFFPQLGPYSSNDPEVLKRHMRQIRMSGAGVIVFSWYPANRSDPNGRPVDGLMPLLLDAAGKEGLKVCLHIEPYKDRSIKTFKEDLEYVKKNYYDHPAFYRKNVNGKFLPVYYIYDSYLTSSVDWSLMFDRSGSSKHNVRGTDLDGVFLGLLVEHRHREDIKTAHFDGFYTYFAANGFTYGSSWKNWRSLHRYAKRSGLIFSPSVGPGYIDTRIRPWNSKNMRNRGKGEYYDMAWKTALSLPAKTVSVTSFNEWHEGTQIEPAVPKILESSGYQYLSYLPSDPNYYLTSTRHWVEKFNNSSII